MNQIWRWYQSKHCVSLSHTRSAPCRQIHIDQCGPYLSRSGSTAPLWTSVHRSAQRKALMQKWLNRTNRHLFSLSYQSQKSSWFTDQQSELYLCENQDFRCSGSHFYYSLFILSFNSLMHSWFSSVSRSGKLVWTSLTDSMKRTESWKRIICKSDTITSLVVLYLLSAFLLLLLFGFIFIDFPFFLRLFPIILPVILFVYFFLFLPLLLSYISTIFHNSSSSFFSFFLHPLLFFHSYFSLLVFHFLPLFSFFLSLSFFLSSFIFLFFLSFFFIFYFCFSFLTDFLLFTFLYPIIIPYHFFFFSSFLSFFALQLPQFSFFLTQIIL